MIEHKLFRRYLSGRENKTFFCIIGRPWFTVCFADIDCRYCMEPWVSSGIGIDTEQSQDRNIKGYLLFHLPDESIFTTLPYVDKAARKSNAIRRIFTFYKDNTFELFMFVIQQDNTINCDKWRFNTQSYSSAPTIYLAMGLASSLSTGMGLPVFSHMP